MMPKAQVILGAIGDALVVCQDTCTGIVFEEDILLVDHDLRRFQYAITNNPLITSHLGTYDVIELTPTTCIVVYSTNVEPEVFALAIGAAAGEGMRFLEKKYGIPKNEGTR